MADVTLTASAFDDRVERFFGSPRFESVLAGLAALAITLGLTRLQATVYNNYVLLADAFLHGHVWIDWPGPYIDALGYHGARYIIEGPIPAILMMPLVAIFGTKANQTAFTCVFAAIAIGAAWYIARTQIGESRGRVAILVGFLALGTDLFWCTMSGAVWMSAHVVADAFMMLALVEVFGRKRAWLILLWLLCAAGARFAVVLAVIPLVPYALSYVPRKDLGIALARCAAVAIPFAIAFVAYNELRWGTPNDIGYTAWYNQDSFGMPDGGPFKLRYFGYELASFFADFPQIVPHYPWVEIGYVSVPLTVTSPGLLVAFFARGQWRLVIALWLATLLIFGPNLIYYANGFAQFGMRHALDFEPFLFCLMVLAVANRRIPQIAVDLLCGVSMVVGIWGIWYWRTFFDSMLGLR
jgi:hypothetical protein